ncbi:hypothetical protein HMPREF1022_00106 [Desulfovibrio sp. 6_1_46AFAA]|uniref:phage antirepressor KilAC domain-containing protein n=1 Tax=Desulfovibrio sp. 6_1_46AFAA TaxID=665942 RepID=UPI0002236D79|nr:phage antirepressor KilAC domain-containing protein [Desulfovibrio sp. 6_1_46AFAA]EGW49593.1 hypothetical protein HMPREF1022_00106 [Desulfovibrio sp. 6_1_46AFAA]
MNELKIFQNKAFGAVRVVEHNGEPWFVAKDIARALDYAEQSNPARLFRSVPEEWKGVKQIHTPGGEQDMLIISEQGLYFFLGRSDKEAALPFQKWAAGEVFPTLRQKGFVGTPPALSREEILSQALEIIGGENAALKQQLAIDAPKVEFAEAVSEAEGGMSVNQLAKVLRQRGIKHMGPHNLFQEMRKHGFLMRQRKHWNVPRQKYIEKGWFKITVHLSPEDDGIQYETTDFAITGPGQLGLLAFFMDKYGISRQLSLLDGRRSSGARTVPAPKGGMPQ